MCLVRWLWSSGADGVWSKLAIGVMVGGERVNCEGGIVQLLVIGSAVCSYTHAWQVFGTGCSVFRNLRAEYERKQNVGLSFSILLHLMRNAVVIHNIML